MYSLALCLAFVLNIGPLPAQKLHTKVVEPLGKIIVYRIWKFSGGGRSLPVILDSQPRIKLENGRYWTFVVSAGDHVLVRTNDFGMKDRIQVQVEANQIIYVDAHYSDWAGTIFEIADDQNEARQRVGRLREQTSTR